MDQDFKDVICFYCHKNLGSFTALSKTDMLQTRCTCGKILEICGWEIMKAQKSDISWVYAKQPEGF